MLQRRARRRDAAARTTPITCARGSSTSSTLAEDVDREHVIASLERAGVATARYLPSIHLQPYMRERYGFREGLCPVSEAVVAAHARRSRSTHAIEPADQEYVVEALAEALA